MQRHVVRQCIPLILLFIPHIVNATGRHVKSSELSKSVNDRSKNLLIILLTPEVKSKTSNTGFDDASTEYGDDSSQDDEPEQLTPKDDEAYFLYHILRTTDKSKLDSKTATTIKRTKEILQPILRSRCKKLEKCKKKCVKVTTTLCTKECVVKIDMFLVCESKPKNNCKKTKCGKTMPPYWR